MSRELNIEEMLSALEGKQPFALVVIGTNEGRGLSVDLMYQEATPADVVTLARACKDGLVAALNDAQKEVPGEP